MSGIKMRVATCPTDEYSLTNRAVVHTSVLPGFKHVEVTNQSNRRFAFTLIRYDKCNIQEICFSLPMVSKALFPWFILMTSFFQRKWAELATNVAIDVRPYQIDYNSQCVSTISLEVDFMMKNTVSSELFDVDEMAQDFAMQFDDQVFTVGQQLAFKPKSKRILKLTVIEMKAVNMSQMTGDAAKTNSQSMVSRQSYFTFFNINSLKTSENRIGHCQHSRDI